MASRLGCVAVAAVLTAACARGQQAAPPAQPEIERAAREEAAVEADEAAQQAARAAVAAEQATSATTQATGLAKQASDADSGPSATQPAATQPADDPAERLPTTRPATAAPVPAPAEADAIRKQVWKEHREAYDKDSDQDRLALAHQLLKRALEEKTDAPHRFVLLGEARDLATDAQDERLAMKAVAAICFYFDVDPTAVTFKALAAANWPTDSDEQIDTLLNDWLALSNLALERREFGTATEAARRASSLSSQSADASWGERATAQLERVRTQSEEAARLAAARKTLDIRPDDPGANFVLGSRAAVDDRWDAALPMLKHADAPAVRSAASRDLAGADEPNAQVNLGDLWSAAAEGQPPAVRDAFLSRARHWYTLAVKRLNAEDQKQIRQRMHGLPGGSVLELAAEAASAPRRSALVGGGGGGPFDDIPADGALLTGVRVTTGQVFGHECITSIQPVFQTAGGVIRGAVHGRADGPAKAVEARDGYAVGAIVAKGGLAVDGFKLVFMRIKGDALDRKDTYDGPWLGGRGGGAETTLGGDGKPLIGLQGRSGDGIDAVGAVAVP